MPEIHLRPTGCSFLVGLIDLPPGDIPNYVNSLRPVLEDWGSASQRIERTSKIKRTKSDPQDFYKTCGYLGIGPWNFITLSLVSDYGLATRLGFIGHARSQDYFHANDISLLIDLTGETISKDCSEGIETLLKINRKMGITDVLKISSNTERTELSKLFLDPGQASRKSILPIDDKYQFNACFRPVYLNHIYSGKDSIYGHDTQFEAVSQLLGKHRNQIKKEGRRVPEEENLVSFHQLKTNPVLNIKYHKGITKFIYLTILTALYERVAENDLKFPLSSYPSMIRPLLSGGYFDFMVLMRGPFSAPMDLMLQRIKYYRVRDAIALLEKKKLDTLMTQIIAQLKKECLELPLFKLSHTTLGAPFTIISHAEQTLKGELLKVKAKPGEKPDALLERHIRVIGNNYDKIKGIFQDYDHPNWSKGDNRKWENSKHNFVVFPRTAVSVKASRGPEVVEILRKSKGIHPNGSDFLNRLLDAHKIANGRYDFYLFENQAMFFGEFLTKLQIMRNLLQLSGYLPSGREMHLFQRRLRSPLLGLHTVMSMSFQAKEAPPPEDLYRGLDQTVFHKPICIVTQENIRAQLKMLHDGYQPTPTSEIKEILRANLKSSEKYWDTWFQSAEEHDLPNQDEAYVFNRSDALIQSGFDRFLRERFASEVSHETLEVLLSTFCLIDGFLVDPLLFGLYLDVVPFLNHFLIQLFTLECRVETENGKEIVRLFYADPEMDRVRQITPTRPPYVGMEAYFIRIADLIQKVLGQRQPGSFPNYDRSFSRLSDLKIQQGKTMTGLSWMAKNLIKNLREYMPRAISEKIDADPINCQGSVVDIDIDDEQLTFGESRKLLDPLIQFQRQMRFPDSNFLPHFSSAPEALLYRFDKSISLNARHLTSIERIVMMAHEIGHLLVDPMDGTYFEPLACNFREKVDTSSNKIDDMWQEVFADLMVYRLCFRPCGLLYDGSFNGKLFNGRKPRVNFLPGTTQYDLCDDFLMAWIFQLLLLAKIKLPGSFKNVFSRLMIELTLLKYFHYYADGLAENGTQKLIGRVYDEQVDPFIKRKLPALFRKFTAFRTHSH